MQIATIVERVAMKIAGSTVLPGGWRRPAVLLAVAAVLAGGAGPAQALIAGTFYVPRGMERVAWLYPGLSQRSGPQITELGPWARTDYARFAGRAGQGEVLYKTANYGPYVFRRPPGLARLAASWNHLRGRIRGWYPPRAVRLGGADATFRRIALDDGRSCVVFSGEGRHVPYDNQARPGLVFFGYFCARRDGLDDEEAARVVSALRLTYDRRTPVPDRPASREAEAIAKGSLETRTGNARFPFELATPYNEYDPGFRRN